MIKQVIFDWKRTLYDPDSKTLIEGALPLLKTLTEKGIKLVLIGKGGEDMYQEVQRLDIEDKFSKIVFAEGEKDLSLFAPFVDKSDPEETVFIGDRVRSELEIGNKLGAVTIWIKSGKFAFEEPLNGDQKPKYTANNLNEAKDLVLSLI